MLSSLFAIAITATVVSVIDGDTIRVQEPDGDRITVRLACIDAPEPKQPAGVESSLDLARLLPPGKNVEVEPVEPIDKDIYGRSIAKVVSDGILINLHLVENGSAVLYPKYFKPCSKERDVYQQAQDSAIANKLGFWSLPVDQQILPWLWRQRKGSQIEPTR